MSALQFVFHLLAAFTVCAQTVPTPQFFPPSGTWVPTNVTITCAEAAAALHYTLDGSAPDTNAPLYTGPLSVTNATTVLVRAFRADQTPSAVAMADYYEADLARIRKSVTNNGTISPAVVLTVTPFEGVACYGVEEAIPAGLEVTEVNIGGVWNATNRTLRWGPYPDASPRLFTYSVREIFRVGVTNEILSRISLNGGSFPADDYNVTVTVQLTPPPPPVATPVFNPPGGVAFPATFSITSTTTNARIYYTLDGSLPTTNSLLYAGDITLTNGATLRAVAFVDGQEPTAAAFATFEPAWEQAAPVRSITNNATAGPLVRLAVAPSAGVECDGVHEVLPPLLVPESISHGGVWTTEDRTIRWGPFRDELPRELSYVVRGPAGDYALEGVGSFDGRNLGVSGASTVTVDNYQPPTETPVFIPADGAATPPMVTILPPPRTFSLRPSASSDDAEEVATNGVVSLQSDGLELGTDTGVEQVMGLRFANVQVPKDAVILDARVQFTQKEDKNVEPFGVVIRAEASGSAASFSTNLFDVSSRTGTVASVLWTNVPAWTAYRESTTNQQTPNLAALVREVLARTNWLTGNSLVFLLTGQGCRTALSYDGYAAQSPRLDITYAVTNGVRIYYTTDGTLPGTNSMFYTGPIAVAGVESLRARSFQDGFAPSEPTWADYHDVFADVTNLWRSVTNNGTVEPEVVVHVIPPAAGESYGVEETLPLALTPTFISPQGVWNETNRTIQWGPFQDAQPRDLSYRVTGWGGTNGLAGVGSFDGRSAVVAGAAAVVTADSTTAAATPVLSPASAETLPATVTITCATPGAEIRYTTDSTLPVASSLLYTGSLTFSNFTTFRARAFRAAMMPSAEAVGVYQQSLEGLGAAGRTVGNATSPAPVITISAAVSEDVESWAVEERLPSVLTPSAISHGGVWLPEEGIIKWGPFQDDVERALTFTAHGPDGSYPLEGTASFNGWNTPVSGEVTLAIADTQTPVATPQFSPADGATVPVSVSISCATTGAEIRYTMDGSVPAPDSALYGREVSVTEPLTLRARAFRAGQNPSDTASATYLGLEVASRVTRRVLDTPFPVQRVELAAQPGGTVDSYAVEETIPVGLVPSGLSHSGVWNPTNRLIKWGPFRDHTERTLAYAISGPDGTYPLDGQGSFDGQPVATVGDTGAVIAFPAPTNLLTVAADRAAYLAWPKMTNASGYSIHYWADGAANRPMTRDAGNPAGEYYALQSLTNNTLYFICVAAYDANQNESSRGEVVTVVPSESAGSLGAVAWNQPYYNPTSEVAVVTLADGNPNTDPNRVETVLVRVSSHSDTLGFDLTLAETGTNSGVFTSAANGTNVGFTFGNSDVLNKLIRVVPGDVLTVRYADVLPPIPTTATAFVQDDDDLPDDWELRYFGNLWSQNSSGDPDNDGVTNKEEYLHGTNPTDASSFHAKLNVVSTGDGTVQLLPSSSHYVLGTTVALAAVPGPDSVFLRWEGDLQGTNNPTTLVMDSHKTVVARFQGTGSVGNFALWFDGVDDYVSIATTGSLAGTFTVEMWAMPAHPTAILGLIGSRSPQDGSFDAKFMSGNRVHGDIGDGGGWITTSADAIYAYAVSNWYHVAYVVTTTNYTVLVNGVVQGQGNYGQNLPLLFDASHRLVIGGTGYSGEPFHGLIDEVRIWSTARTPEQIQTKMLRRLSGTETGLVASWSLDDGAGLMAFDLTAQGFDGALGGGNAQRAPAWVVSTVALSEVLRPVLSSPTMTPDGLFRFLVSSDPDQPSLQIRYSTNLVNWETLTNLLNPPGSIVIGDAEAGSRPARFYRAVSP